MGRFLVYDRAFRNLTPVSPTGPPYRTVIYTVFGFISPQGDVEFTETPYQISTIR